MGNDAIPIDVYINKHYEKIKRLLMCEWRKSSLNEFDEDLFHNTLLNTLKTLSGSCLTERETTNYIVAAFKSNSLREMMYYRNSMKVDADITILGELVEMDDLDYDRIILNAEKHFGFKATQAFVLWTEGYTIKDIEEKLDCNQLTYQIKKIRDWVKETYSEFK